MMEDFLYFFSFKDPNVLLVVIGMVMLSLSASLVGTFTFLKKKSLVGDAVAHAVLPGVCLAFIFAQEKNPVFLIIGAFVTGWLSLLLIDLITSQSRIKEDTAIGMVLSVFFGFGILLLTKIQQTGNAAQSGLDAFLFGRAAAMVAQDVWVFSVLSIILLIVVFVYFKALTLIAFDESFAKTIGYPIRRFELLLSTLTVLAVVIGIQAVGVVLIAALLITPAAAARFWTNRLKKLMVLAGVFGCISGMAGAYVSFAAPAMPTGPWVVMFLSIIALFSFFFAPNKGIWFKYMHQQKIQRKITDENILKVLYQMGDKFGDFYLPYAKSEILSHRELNPKQVMKGLKRLKNKSLIKATQGKWQLTEAGKASGQRTLKLHRLWEVYLTSYLRIAPDHVHDDAETIEHIISPELERKLEQLLNYPKQDPHDSTIPY